MAELQSVVREILDLTALANAIGGNDTARVSDFRHVATGQGAQLTPAGPGNALIVPGTGDFRLALVTVPPNESYIATFVSIRSFFVDVIANREPYPFTEIDQRGYGSLRFRVNGSFQSRADANYLLLANHPCLFVFNPGDQVELIINRADIVSGTAGFPGIVNIASRLNGYFTRPAIGERFSGMQTRLIAVPATAVLL